MKRLISIFAIFVASLISSQAFAGTSLELLHGWNYNKDFNGSAERTILTIKTFQPWSFGTFFMYYDITGPFTPMDSNVLPNEKGGFFGGTSVTVSPKKITEKIKGREFNWGPLLDTSLRAEIEHVSKFGGLMYYGTQFDFRVPLFDFFSVTAVARDDWALKGIALQLGMAWQMTFKLGNVTDIVFAGFLQAGVTAEGKGEMSNVSYDFATGDKVIGTPGPAEGRRFLLTQPQLMFDLGKLVRLTEGKIYLGCEYQVALNRYLQDGIDENVAQAMLKWNI